MRKLTNRIKKLLLISIFWGILSLSFLFFAFLIVLKANGYQLNYKTGHIIKTGMIILDGEPRDVTIQMNGKDLKTGFPKRISNLPAGNYKITISHDKYQGWSKAIRVDSGIAIIYEDITLFREKAEDANLQELITIDKLSTEYTSSANDLTIKDTEIYYRENLVTRFSQKILAAALYLDNKHIVCQISNEVRVIDLDGSNNKLLFNLVSSEPSMFAFRNNGSTTLYLDEGGIKAKNIR